MSLSLSQPVSPRLSPVIERKARPASAYIPRPPAEKPALQRQTSNKLTFEQWLSTKLIQQDRQRSGSAPASVLEQEIQSDTRMRQYQRSASAKPFDQWLEEKETEEKLVKDKEKQIKKREEQRLKDEELEKKRVSEAKYESWLQKKHEQELKQEMKLRKKLKEDWEAKRQQQSLSEMLSKRRHTIHS